MSLSLLLLTGCGPVLHFNCSQDMTPDEMLRRADLVLIGVIEKHDFNSWPGFRVIGLDEPDMARRRFWRVVRRQQHPTARRILPPLGSRRSDDRDNRCPADHPPCPPEDWPVYGHLN